MGIDLGYDLYPPLTLEDKPRWIQCLQFIAYHYKEDPKVRVNVDRIEFHVGEHPTLYFSTDKFRRFTSKVSGSGSSAEPYLRTVGAILQKFFGEDRIHGWSDYTETDGPYSWSEVYEATYLPTRAENLYLISPNRPTSMIFFSEASRSVLHAFEQIHTGMHGLVYDSAEFPVEKGYYIRQKEHGGLMRPVRSIHDWCLPGSADPVDSAVRKAYWATRCHNNCETINRALLHVLQKKFVVISDMSNCGYNAIQSSSLSIRKIGLTPKYVGTIVEPPFVSKVPDSPDGETYHTFVTGQDEDGVVYALDASCAQFGVFEGKKDTNFPFIAIDLVLYLQRVGKHRILPPHEAVSKTGLESMVEKKIQMCLSMIED